MARPRLPQDKAEVSGAALHDPQRFRDRKKPRTRPLGEPFVKMTDEQKAAWEEFRQDLPWLDSSHRRLLHAACVMAVRLDEQPELGVNQIQTFVSILSKLGATPTEQTKVKHHGEEEVDPADAFFDRPH